MQFNILNIL